MDVDANAMAATSSNNTTTLPIMVPDYSTDDIRDYLTTHLTADLSQHRPAIAAKMLAQAPNDAWARLAVAIVNHACADGVSGEVILSMLDDIGPSRPSTLDELYAWKLRKLNKDEQGQAVLVMLWVLLAPEPLLLNELLVALRLSLVVRRRQPVQKKENGQGSSGSVVALEALGKWDAARALDVDPPVSLRDLRKSVEDDESMRAAMDSPSRFWAWVQHISQGLLKLEPSSEPGEGGVSSQPLGLQKVRPVDKTVLGFFLKGRGLQSLLLASHTGSSKRKVPPTDRLVDNSYYALLHACLTYLNITELDSLGRERVPVNPTPGENLPAEELSKWKKHSEDQRKMILSAYPLLRYVVENLVFHLLCPRKFRYFFPQTELLRLLSANRCRIWRRWTHLLGFGIHDATPEAILNKAEQGLAKKLLDPVYGARYRVERVLRKVWKIAMEQQQSGCSANTPASPSVATSPRKAHFRNVSERSVVFSLVGEGPDAAPWLVPGKRTGNASPASPATPATPMSPVFPHSPTRLQGIKERG